MTTFIYLVKRNTKLFFKDKGNFFPALVAPLILLVLFISFLGNVYVSSFHESLPEGLQIPEQVIDGFVGGFLLSSLLAVTCVTVAFNANMIMVQDKVTGAVNDLTIAPIKKSVLALSYYVSTVIVTLIICFVTTGAGLIYLSQAGWYMSAVDVALVFGDVILLVLFGTALSSILGYFLKSQGGITAVCTIMSACYGFVCGAYMPIAQFSEGIQKFISYLPGTYGTGLLRNHFMRGVYQELETEYFPAEVIKEIQDGFDFNFYFRENLVEVPQMYVILGVTIIAALLIYIVLNMRKKGNSR